MANSVTNRSATYARVRIFCLALYTFSRAYPLLFRLFNSFHLISLPQSIAQFVIRFFYVCFAAFLKAGNYNVILVDWSPMTVMPWYTNAVENLPVAARFIARFLRFLVANGYQARLIHLIGFSLGAEVAGFVGKQLLEWGVVLPRITGKLVCVRSGNARQGIQLHLMNQKNYIISY